MSNGGVCTEPRLSSQEAKVFITEILQIDLPTSYPPSIEWINQLIQAFQRKLPFQNVTLLSQHSHFIPTWENIYRDILIDGKGGLCLSLNVALTAVLSSLGVTAYNAAADYVPLKARGVHVVTVIHFGTTAEVKLQLNKSNSRTMTRSKTQVENCVKYQNNAKVIKKNVYHKQSCCNEDEYRRKPEFFRTEKSTVYLADVGCGYPTLQAINLKDDLKKIFINCGLEYCFIKKGHQYLRMHRRGHDFNEGEKEHVNIEGWLPVFSLKLIPRDMSFFQHSMRCIYLDMEKSPYFTELHCVLYQSTNEMLAVKDEVLIKHLRSNKNVAPSDQLMEESTCSERRFHSNGERVQLSREKLQEVFHKFFSMIPISEVKKAIDRYFCGKMDVLIVEEKNNSYSDRLLDQINCEMKA